MNPDVILGGVEAGGTKIMCALGSAPDAIVALARIPTTDPDRTVEEIVEFFLRHEERPAVVGIGSFGPLDPDAGSPTYGTITNTPKTGWREFPLGPRIAVALGVPFVFDTDVNAAATGEHRWGAARDVDSFIYMTIGTGIGGGALVRGRRLHGLIHPEMGHLMLPRVPGDAFEGVCPFHGDCLEGLASGTAMRKRWGCPAEDLPLDHPGWRLEASYIALALINLSLTLSPQRIVIGGGVTENRSLLPIVREEFTRRLNGYVRSPIVLENVDSYVVEAGLGDRAGVLGALAMAEEARVQRRGAGPWSIPVDSRVSGSQD
ncbi:MAG TPA: ROK family protein [Gemmatimonadota bacterium]|nr:ROK family protein [Gemmatimonadota bacterium]